jgi:hypothetical protein
MISMEILERFGTSNKRLREVLTSKARSQAEAIATVPEDEVRQRVLMSNKNTQDIAYREQLEGRFRARIDEGVVRSLTNYQFFAAADLAWDTSAITRATIPLLLYAQGNINIQTAATALKKIGGAAYTNHVRENDRGEPVNIDIPKFFECNINIVRSFVTRRLSAQANIFGNLYPYYSYEARTTGLVGKCRADVLSQRVDMMADQFGYRNHDVQCMRDAFLYSRSVDFVKCAWDVERQWVKKAIDKELDSNLPPTDNSDLDSEVVKEGLPWFKPHPSRVFWDNAYPLSSLNTDSGCEFIGYWDIVRFKDVMYNPAFFNVDAIGWSTRFWGMGGIFLNYKAYFDQFVGNITPPSFPQGTTTDPAGENDRAANIGVYNVNQGDVSLLITQYFEKLVPKDFGIGDYPFPVWFRFIVASDATIVFAEILPSSPCAVLSLNCNDDRMVNVSMAHELMAYQDQLTNLFNQMLIICKNEAFKTIGINTDALNEAQVKQIEQRLKGHDWSSAPIVYQFSLAKLKEELGIKPDQVMVVSDTKVGQSLTAIFESIAKLIAMAEKLMAMSPAETGQPAPREISATEVTEIASTTSSVYSYLTQAINEFRNAKKRIIYDSLVACSQGKIKCPVEDRYTKETIKKAGFEIVDQSEEGTSSPGDLDRMTVIGTARDLIFDYYFSSRDGEERAVKSQAANTLVQLVGVLTQNPVILQAMGKEKLYMIANEIVRMSGAGIDLNLELKPGESNDIGQDPQKQMAQQLDGLQKGLQQLAQSVQQDVQATQQQQGINKNVADHLKLLPELAGHVQTLMTKNARPVDKIPYDAAPFSIQAQIEKALGLNPATDADRIMSDKAKKGTP